MQEKTKKYLCVILLNDGDFRQPPKMKTRDHCFFTSNQWTILTPECDFENDELRLTRGELGHCFGVLGGGIFLSLDESISDRFRHGTTAASEAHLQYGK